MLDRLRAVIEKSHSIVFFGGAGVSTESGIPDFRSETGLYKAKEVYGHSPEELLSHDLFIAEPALFYRYYRENLIVSQAKPNAAHKALATLEKRGRLSAVVTQNIDGLHQAAGSKTVWELHGSVHRYHCIGCGARYDLAWFLDAEEFPRCGRCRGMVRPDVVLYQESLDDAVISGSVRAIGQADTMIVGGTSLAVYPAAGLLRHFWGNTVVLINRDETPFDKEADLVIHDSIGAVLGAVVPDC